MSSYEPQGGDRSAPVSEARIDLHCHSRFSASQNQWLTAKLGFKTSYTLPATIYGLAKMRGMTHVTLTDHNSIEGALRLAHHDDFIIGEEVTAFLPSEALHVHVLVWGIDEPTHAEIGELRFNVYELVEYLRGQGVAHALAHPFSLVAGGLRGEQLEAMLALFDVWEVRNGLGCRAENELAQDLVTRSASLRAGLGGGAAVHSVAPIGVCAGSDDHTGLDIGMTFTAIPLSEGQAPLAAIMSGLGGAHGAHGSTAKLAHSGVALLRGGVGESGLVRQTMSRVTGSPLLWRLLQSPGRRRSASRAVFAVAGTALRRDGGRRLPTKAAVRSITKAFLRGDPLGQGLRHEELQSLVEEVWRDAMRYALGEGQYFELIDLFGDKRRLAAIADAQGLLGPYLLASGFHARQRRHTASVARRLAERGLTTMPPVRYMPRVAVFTDTYDEINGVSSVLRQLRIHATGHDWPLTLVSAGAERRSEPGHEVFPAIMTQSLAVYPGFPMALLPILELLRWCEEAEIDVIHVVTPGPVGLVAWLLANSLDLPIAGTYHTDLPNLGFSLTGDHLLRESLWAYVRLFYDQCAIVFCPSEATRQELIEHRVKSRLEPFPQGVDCDLFSPARRDTKLWQNLGGGKHVLLWVGRISPEKGLDALADSYAALRARRDDVQLVVVGEGPYQERLREHAPSASFLGVKTGEELAAIFASADVFLFPGHGETFGQTVLEAAASGLPAVVSAGSGTADAMVRDVTALSVAPGSSRGFAAAVERLLDDPQLHAEMAAAAREFALSRTWPATFDSLANAYHTITP
jgi:glycosyltransferase involved in cell wall biosynthesis